MHRESWTVSRIPAEPEEAWSVTSRTLGWHAAWDQSRHSRPEKKPRALNVAVIECLE